LVNELKAIALFMGLTRKYFFHSAQLLLLLVITKLLMAQDTSFQSIQQRFEQFNKQSSQEKIYLHTDKNFYLAGEIVWFKLYCADAASLRPASASKVAYAEILDRSNKPVLQAKIDLTVKGGSGSFYLPLSLTSGNYILRAYTSRMKNDGPTVYFEKIISIANTIKPVELQVKHDTARFFANFFPEAGNMVQGIETKLAFHITDQYGKGVNANGIITNANGDTISSFSTAKFGMGNFLFKPLQGHGYRATIHLSGDKIISKDLPVVYDHGYVMNVADNHDGKLKVRIQAKGNDPVKRGEHVFLLAHSRQKIKVAETGFVNYETDLVFTIDKAQLNEGITHFTLFNKDQQPVCERLVFKKPNRKDTVQINSDKNSYQLRQKVNLSLSSVNEEKHPGISDCSIAVYKIDSLEQLEQDDLVSYLLLTTDLKGEVESPGFYFSDEKGTEEVVDNLMLTHGWRRFKWENILSGGQTSAPGSLTEQNGHIVTAKIINAEDQQAAAGVDCFLSCPGAPFGFYGAKSNEKGIVQFEIKKYYGPGEVIIQAGRDTTNKYRIDVLTPFTDELPLKSLSYLSFKKENEAMFADKSVAMQTQNIYLADSIRRFMLPVLKDTFPFFGTAEYSYRLDDYKRFTTMEEVLREYVRPVNVVLRNGKLYMRIYDDLYVSLYNDVSQAVYGDDMLVMLDGVPLFNHNKIFSYDPLKVKKLEVVPQKYMMGGNVFNGILSLESYSGKFDGFEMLPGVVAIDYEGLQMQREFYSPDYETNAMRLRRIPDFRSTLYWTPQVSTDKNGKAFMQFYTSDIGGKFKVVLQGFNVKGEAVTATTNFEVE
jgi:hypothetical protein